MIRLLGLLLALSLTLSSCSEKKGVEITDFNPFSNYPVEDSMLSIAVNLDNAIRDGITIPNPQDDLPYFQIRFTLKNTGTKAKKFAYKVFYQNESYKHSEWLESGKYNPKAEDNFYGSWESDDFHYTPRVEAGASIEIIDSIRIMGNPRNEVKYFGAARRYNATLEDINRQMDAIKGSGDWMDQIREKALQNKIEIEEQVYKDALWMLNRNSTEGEENHRWKRNPRMGTYKFSIAVGPEEDIDKLPPTAKFTSIPDTTGYFINPFFFFEKNTSNEGVWFYESPYHLKVRATIDGSHGVFVNRLKYPRSKLDTTFFGRNVSDHDSLVFTALFEQYFHEINRNFSIKNIKVQKDVVGGKMTQKDYSQFSQYSDNQRVEGFFKITEAPGRTVYYDEEKGAIVLQNPPSDLSKNMTKENVGINTRIGLQYGTYRARIRFPEIISEDYVWNGITCAFWLIYQEESEWNHRSSCASGYIPKHIDGETDIRVKENHYSEIDIEIVKASKHWPKTSYPPNSQVPVDDALNSSVIVTATNWDLACSDPSGFSIGASSFGEYTTHRWNHWYKALSIKSEQEQQETLGKDLYYEIQWKPDEIVWRIGSSPEDMRVFARMDSTITTIPDNQMLTVITQEYHDASWWPTTPFKQDNIPFPAKPITGYVYEVVVE